jgi:hypothetical protein
MSILDSGDAGARPQAVQDDGLVAGGLADGGGPKSRTVPASRREGRKHGTLLSVVSLWLFTFAAGTIVLGSLLYESTNRSVLNRYSVAWFVFICFGLVGFGALGANAALKHRFISRLAPNRRADVEVYVFALALAAAAWGTSLLTQFAMHPQHIERLLHGEIFGATQTPGILLEYLAQCLICGTGVVFLTTHAWRLKNGEVSGRVGILLSAAAVLVVYVLAEGAVRIVNVVWPRPQGAPTKPSWIWHDRYVYLNARGYRDGEFERRSDGGERRILVLGDSYAYGWGIENTKDRLTEVLASRLSAAGQFGRLRVFNAGVPATHSGNHLETLKNLLPVVEPDLVLLIYVFNDIEHVSLPAADAIYGSRSLFDRVKPYRFFMLNSHLFDQLLLRYRAFSFHRGNPRLDHFVRAYADPRILEEHLKTLTQMRAMAEGAGVTFRLVPFDTMVRRAAAHRDRYAEFEQACRERGIPVWSMGTIFEGFEYESLTVNGWDHHPNKLAHRLAGEFLAARVLLEGIARERRAGKGPEIVVGAGFSDT